MQKFNLHIHSTFSDGKDSIEDIVLEAQKLGLTSVGISDHFRLSPPSPTKLKLENIDLYCKTIDVVSFKHHFPVFKGLEFDLPLSPEEEATCSTIKKQFRFDYFIGSVHPSDKNYQAWNVSPSDPIHKIIEHHRLYWQDIEKLALNPDIDIMGHLDYIKSSGIKTEHLLWPEIESVLRIIKQTNKIVEINTSGLFSPQVREMYPSSKIITRCKELQIPMIFSSDAHAKENLIRGFTLEKLQLYHTHGMNNMVNMLPLTHQNIIQAKVGHGKQQ